MGGDGDCVLSWRDDYCCELQEEEGEEREERRRKWVFDEKICHMDPSRQSNLGTYTEILTEGLMTQNCVFIWPFVNICS